jgi:hypothetical protein
MALYSYQAKRRMFRQARVEALQRAQAEENAEQEPTPIPELAPLLGC